MAAFRRTQNYISTQPQNDKNRTRIFSEALNEKFLWLRFRQLSDVTPTAMGLFDGSLAARRSMHRDFRGFIRQARTYWDAGLKTQGSAAALPFYYGALQLAKAELLLSDPKHIQRGSLHHGLRQIRNQTASIKSDYLAVTDGVFPMLYKKRTGMELPVGTKFKIVNLLSLIPEIGLEMGSIGSYRTPTSPGNYAIAMNDEKAWSLAMFPYGIPDPSEPVYRKFFASYEELEMSEFANWREVFSVSSRMYGASVQLFQARRTFPAQAFRTSALSQLSDALGAHLSPPRSRSVDFYLTPTLKKSEPLLIPLDLVRYAVMFYLSSLVRYKPSTLDPQSHGDQAFLMDSFTNEVPIHLLAGSLDGITGENAYYIPNEYRY